MSSPCTTTDIVYLRSNAQSDAKALVAAGAGD